GEDEKAVTDYLKSTPPKAIINIVDGTNLERNLYLTTELLELNMPLVIAVNMADELNKNGIKLNVKKFSELFGVPVVAISALKNTDTDKLVEVAKILESKKSLTNFNFNNAEERYSFIEKNIQSIVVKKQTKAEKFTLKADAILTHKFFGFPIFFAVITAVYFLSMKIGGALGDIISGGFNNCSKYLANFLYAHEVADWLVSLLCHAVLKGMGTVCSFLPQILILFALLTLIEQSGYASRIAFILDRLFRTFGLGGKSLIPITVACGCTVSGLMATKTIEDKSEKRMTVFLAPFMPCGAKTAVYGWMAYEFFNGSALVASSMYFLGIISVAVFGGILKRFKVFRDGGGEFILEMPTLRYPSYKDVLLTLWEKSKDFLVKAGSIIFLVTVCLWVLQNFGFHGYTGGNAEESFLYHLGNALKFIFYPLGFGNWQATVAMLSSILAKEAVVESLTMISSHPESLFFSQYSVYAFMTFLLLSPPCIAALATAKRELKSTKWFIFMISFQFFSAYLVAFLINGVGFLITTSRGLLLSLIIVIIIILGAVLVVKSLLKKGKCAGCKACKKERKCLKRNTI
ncbi:MAG: ferrous iron transporter B, partial [Clostridia bacterium]|nr:ferrous iron transporter B [Clostridia bacterium]